MKLVNFLHDRKLNKLREKMGAELVQWSGSAEWKSFDPFGFRAALRDKGEVDLPLSEINVSEDSTLELYGQKILVYIRDQRYSYDMEYKFHIANCSTIIDARRSQRYDKYVASVNTDGLFKVNLIHGGHWVEKDKEVKLKVCKNCLNTLNYKGYRSNYRTKQAVYSNFSLAEYFSLFKTQNIIKPKHTNVTAPINNYTKDFNSIATELKRVRDYTCEHCSIDLKLNKKFLHVHHVDGIKSNNNLNNLKVVCIECHSKQSGHGHMRALPDYREFQELYG